MNSRISLSPRRVPQRAQKLGKTQDSYLMIQTLAEISSIQTYHSLLSSTPISTATCISSLAKDMTLSVVGLLTLSATTSNLAKENMNTDYKRPVFVKVNKATTRDSSCRLFGDETKKCQTMRSSSSYLTAPFSNIMLVKQQGRPVRRHSMCWKSREQLSTDGLYWCRGRALYGRMTT